MRKTQFPRLVIPLAVVMTEPLQPGGEPDRGLRLHPRVRHPPTWAWLAFPFIVAALLCAGSAVSMIVSALFPRFRDTAIIWGVSRVALLRDADRLHARLGIVPETMRRLIIMFNPIASLLELARMSVIDPTAPSPAALAGGAVYLLVPRRSPC